MKLLTSLLLVLCLLGCSSGRRHRQILFQAQSVIEHQADSAYNLLSSLKFEDIKSKENRALYALLYTKAHDKRQIKIMSDSLISIALDYYQNHGSRFHKASAYFYSARVDWNNEDISEAVRKLSYAEEIAPQDSLYLRGLIYGAMAVCYEFQFNNLSAIDYHKKGYEIFCQLDIAHNKANSLYSQATQYGFLKDYDVALKLCQESKEIYCELRDTTNMQKCDIATIKYRIRNGEDIISARRAFFRAREVYANYPHNEKEYYLLSDLYRYDKADSSAYYQQKIISAIDTTTLKQKASFYAKSAKLAITNKNYILACSFQEEANKHIHQFYKDNLKNSVGELSEKYKGELHKARAKRLKSERDNIWTLCIVLLCLAVAIIFITIKHYKSRLRKADEDLGAAQDLAQAIANTQAAMNISPDDPSDSERLDNINYMMSRFNTLIEKMPNYESRPRKFVDEFIAIMSTQAENEENKTIFYEIINRNYPSVLTSVASTHNLSTAEIEVLCMLALGISNNAIRILMNHSNNKTIYNIRSTIKSKLEITLDSKSILVWLDTISLPYSCNCR